MVDVSCACLLHVHVLAWDVSDGMTRTHGMVETSETYMIQRLQCPVPLLPRCPARMSRRSSMVNATRMPSWTVPVSITCVICSIPLLFSL